MPGVGLPDLLEGEVVADGEYHHRHHRHPQEVHDDVRVQVVAVLPQVRHLEQKEKSFCAIQGDTGGLGPGLS